MIQLVCWFLGKHVLIMVGVLFMFGLLIGVMGTLLVRDCTRNDSFDEMDEIPEEKEKAELTVCSKPKMWVLSKWKKGNERKGRGKTQNDFGINKSLVKDYTQLFFKLLAFRSRTLRRSNSEKLISLRKVPSSDLTITIFFNNLQEKTHFRHETHQTEHT